MKKTFVKLGDPVIRPLIAFIAVFILTLAMAFVVLDTTVKPMMEKIEVHGLKSVVQDIWEGSGEPWEP